LGQLTSVTVSGDRQQVKVTYSPSVAEQSATLQFGAHTVDIDPATGTEFTISKRVTLLLGQRATAEQSINPALGGDVSLSDSQDPSKVSIPANAFLNEDGTSADATTSYALTMTSTDDAESVGAASLGGAMRVSRMMQRGASALRGDSRLPTIPLRGSLAGRSRR